jgi:hypothetical protein
VFSTLRWYLSASNVEKHQSEVPWRSLPKTFQEALELTARLGLCFPWIDSLCVIQDDPDDWRHESAKMASIYLHQLIHHSRRGKVLESHRESLGDELLPEDCGNTESTRAAQ